MSRAETGMEVACVQISVTQDLWSYLANTEKAVVLYGMGNGADKILAVCEQKGIAVSDFFASDGFVRGHLFHGKPVLSWGEIKEKYGAENVIVLLSFGTSREDVLENIERIEREAELYAPDVPAFGDGVFDLDFFNLHKEAFERAYRLLSDSESRRIFENVIAFKLTGRIDFLRDAESNMEKAQTELVCPETLHTVADLGAYNGDTVREILGASETVKRVYAMEPDARNFKKLQTYAEHESRAEVVPIHAGAWSKAETLRFDASGNRNASFGANRSEVLADRPVKWKEIEALPLDEVLQGASVEYIKYDVEGAEHEAILGSQNTIRTHLPTLLVSLYHRNEDLYDLPLLLNEQFPAYKGYYLRRKRGVPAWDLNLYVRKEEL